MLPETKSKKEMKTNYYYDVIYSWLADSKSVAEFGKACADIQDAFNKAISLYGRGKENDVYSCGVEDGKNE